MKYDHFPTDKTAVLEIHDEVRLCGFVNILESVNSHDDLLQLSSEDRLKLCSEIRKFLVTSVSQTGGHLASNLGAVELSVAIETVFNTMEDRLVFDVGHQSYVHKLLTGRQAEFSNLRQFGGMAGFPKPSESDADAFVAGHASSSVSIALGMARARTLQNQNYHVIALLGDGAVTGGMAYEGLNDAAVSQEPMIIILNDNEMSIDRNVGGMARHLSRLRAKEQYVGFKRRYRETLRRIPGGKVIYRVTRGIKDWFKRMVLPSTIFENMGLKYLGPVDGHDLPGLISLLKTARDMKCPVLVHVITKKGNGYLPAEADPSKFHGIGRFDPESGKTFGAGGNTFSSNLGSTLLEIADENAKVCAITAAMPSGTGLLNFQRAFPKRTFDVGIAEEHAVSMAGGLAKQGMIPVVALYSTFLQRSFDQIMQDIAMLRLHVVLAVDRAGLVGEDGETHHGIYDVGFLRQVPGMTILCPASLAEQKDMLRWSVLEQNGPVAIRYPRGGNRGYEESAWSNCENVLTNGAVHVHRRGDDITLVTYGTVLSNVLAAADLLEEQGIHATVIRLLSVAPLPADAVIREMSRNRHIVVVEEVGGNSGIRDALSWEICQQHRKCKVDGIDLGDRFVTHGDLQSLYQHYGLDAQSIAEFTREVIKGES